MATQPPGSVKQRPRGGFFFGSGRGTIVACDNSDDKWGTNRRDFLKTGGAALAAGGIAAPDIFIPGAALAAGPTPEVKGAKLGFIALTDAAPLIMAKELGLFAKYGMPDVQVAKQASWAATRDNLVLGSGGGGIDGAHILTPMPYLMTMGKAGKPTPMSILARLNVNGQGISVEKKYLAAHADLNAGKMRGIIDQKKKAGDKITMAMTFPGGTHDLWIRYWLAAAGIDPDKDIELITIPPPQMVANMKAGTMEAFCVGEPWHDQLISQGLGYTAVSTGQTKTSRSSSANAAINSFAGPLSSTGHLANLVKLNSATALDGEGTTLRQTTLTTTITARVVDVLPNGYLVVEGSKTLAVNSENQVITLRGVVRPADLTNANIVQSGNVAQMELKINGKGVVNDVIHRPNFLYRILLGLLPF